jgi:hypothetical protein
MGEVVGFPDPVTQVTQLLADNEFLSDLCRFQENILTEKFIRRKYSKKYGKLDEAIFVQLGENEELIAAIENEALRRQRSGETKIELAQKHITKGPDILNSIMSDEKAPPGRRVDAIKTLDALATPAQQAGTPDNSKFIITIVMGDQSLHFEKPLAVGADPDDSVNLQIDKPEGDSDGAR